MSFEALVALYLVVAVAVAATLAKVVSVLRSPTKDMHPHGQRTCPKCHVGFMGYRPMGNSSAYVCDECGWMEFQHPPWKDKNGG